LPGGIQNDDCLCGKVDDSVQLLFVGKKFGLSELDVASMGHVCQFLGTRGGCGIPVTTLCLHVNGAIFYFTLTMALVIAFCRLHFVALGSIRLWLVDIWKDRGRRLSK
jgi:hypothetical protein